MDGSQIPKPGPLDRLPLTVLIAAKNVAAGLDRCLAALGPAARVVVLDSHSTDGTVNIALGRGAEVVQFDYRGGYPKKRQWALDNLDIATDWVLLLDADEIVPPPLWDEIGSAIAKSAVPAFFITKSIHFLGRRLRFGGFSYATVLLFRRGCARFEHNLDDQPGGMDMEVHERLIVDGPIGRLRTRASCN